MMDHQRIIMGEDAALFEHIWKTGKNFYITVSILAALVLWGIYAYVTQYRIGLGVTGLSRQIFWGTYITNFVFFIGISHAGTFISAVLRVVKAEWRRPISRLSELTTVFILMFGVGSVLIDLGRADRMLNVIRYANFRSPLLWDICSIATYLTVSSTCLYLALIPDIALLRDIGGKRQWFYRALSLGWTGTERQHHVLEKAIGAMSVLVIPVMITVHTVVSFVFAMTIQPMWHSAIFGPYFVVGAIFSGVASVIVIMVVLRKVYHLENYIKPIHFNNIGVFLMAMTLLWFYFTSAEYVTIFYGNEPVHMEIFWMKLTGKFAPLFWLHFVLCFVIPLPILAKKVTNDSGNVHCVGFYHSWDVAGTVRYHRPNVDESENACGRSLLYPDLGGSVDPGRLHRPVYASLHPIHESISYCSCLGSERRPRESGQRY